VATGKAVLTLTPQISNQYTKNRATYSPTDELVLSDGVLWDVNSGKEIHKLDKLNQTLSGVFHPNGLEVNLLLMYGVRCALFTGKSIRTYWTKMQ
jgi:HIV-1 Vpr-binding protein